MDEIYIPNLNVPSFKDPALYTSEILGLPKTKRNRVRKASSDTKVNPSKVGVVSKESVMMRDVICQFHPDFVNNAGLHSYALSHPHVFDVETLIEEALAAVGSYEHTSVAHADFSDGSDSKTSTITCTPNTDPSKVGKYSGVINGVITSAGTPKSGALRCTIYNSVTQSLLFYYLPKDVWMGMVTYSSDTGKGRIAYTWNRHTESIAKFDGYELGSFKALARKKD